MMMSLVKVSSWLSRIHVVESNRKCLMNSNVEPINRNMAIYCGIILLVKSIVPNQTQIIIAKKKPEEMIGLLCPKGTSPASSVDMMLGGKG
mmetsp:Transcript_34126/g.66080  ORF Transcript_34126/g.66080 Transcript_34126/m.66080 type:complete len:91 (+) Transcript_34126:1001-1273(+)